jgi:hypothetical protein
VAEFAGQLKESSRLASERLDLLDRLPRHDPAVGGEVADIFHMATESAMYAGELPLALDGARRAHADQIDKGLPYLASSRLVIPLALQGAFDDALAHAAAMRETWERAGRPAAGWMAPSAYATALVYGLRGDGAAHDRWCELADRICIEGTAVTFGEFVEQRVALHLGQRDRALAVPAPPPDRYGGHYNAYQSGISVEVAVMAGDPDAERLLDAMVDLATENDYVAACLARSAGRLHHDGAELERAVRLWEAIGARFERACTLMLIDARAGEGRTELEALGCPLPAVFA